VERGKEGKRMRHTERTNGNGEGAWDIASKAKRSEKQRLNVVQK